MLDISGGVANSIALSPLLVALYAGEGTGQGGAARAAVFVRLDMAWKWLVVSNRSTCQVSKLAVTHQILQRVLSGGSDIFVLCTT